MSFNENALRLAQHPLSYSKLSVAETCGFRFSKQYIERVKPVDPVSTADATVGIVVHALMERALLRCIQNDTMPSEEAITVAVDASFNEAFAEHKITVNESERIGAFIMDCKSMLDRLVRFIFQTKSKVFIEVPLAIDQDFNAVDFGDPKAFFRGKLDLVLVAPSGQVAIIDHKTGRRNEYQSPEQVIAGFGNQLRAYEILVLFGLRAQIKTSYGIDIKSAQTGLNFIGNRELVWSSPTTFDQIRDEGVARFITWVNDLSDRAVEGKVNRGNHCNWCGYKSLCGSKRGLKKKAKTVAL